MIYLQQYAFPSGVVDEEVVEQEGLRGQFKLPGIEYKAPQLLAIAYGLDAKRFVLSYDKGMGKTIIYMSILHFAGVTKYVILCSKNAMIAQVRELNRFFPHLRVALVESNDRAKRAAIWQSDVDVFIASTITFLADMGLRANSQSNQIIPDKVARLPIIVDEYHKYFRNRNNNIFNMLEDLPKPYFIPSSGSAGGKGPQDIWAALHLCNPPAFRGYWPYVNKFTHVAETRWGRQISGVKNIEEWRKTVSSNVIHRKKDGKDYPPKTRQALDVKMHPWEKKIHDQLRNELWAIWKDESSGEEKMILTPNTLAATMKIRQFLVCPKILDDSLGYGSGLEAIWEDVSDSELTHWVVSTPFRAGLPYISQFFTNQKAPLSLILAGNEYKTADLMANAIKRWQARGGPAIQTIKFAESYELPPARYMYMLGYEYSADQNSQAEDRIHRDIRVTPDPVDIYYVRRLDSYDSQLIQMISEGADIQHEMMNKPLTELFL